MRIEEYVYVAYVTCERMCRLVWINIYCRARTLFNFGAAYFPQGSARNIPRREKIDNAIYNV